MSHDLMQRHQTGLIRSGGASDPIGIVDEIQARREALRRASAHMSEAGRRRALGLPPQQPGENRDTVLAMARPAETAETLRRREEAASIQEVIAADQVGHVRVSDAYDALAERQKHAATFSRIVEIVADVWDVSPHAIIGTRRGRQVALARRCIFVLVERVTGLSYANSARMMRRDHTTVLYSLAAHERTLALLRGDKTLPNLRAPKTWNRRHSTSPTNNLSAARRYMEAFREVERRIGDYPLHSPENVSESEITELATETAVV